ncbi:hypothetical protein IW139_005078, partial [Coemansia sp. RSA 353]
MTTLSNWEEEGMVEDILVKIESLDQFAPELTSSLKNGMLRTSSGGKISKKQQY